ncbi:hypothetical protein L915_02023 [Phytophthora nicotianae]|uniref:SP-RING-type domain-containing protein n=1 Tax=Phytophthora nicotianae TaxID=4792 RepID=W2HKB8_PHYNI|nr:hypothetical protein L915_02023 [Phytophthora nicotianae]
MPFICRQGIVKMQGGGPGSPPSKYKELSPEDSTSEVTITLTERIKELEQRNQELEERYDELDEQKQEIEKEKKRFAKKAGDLEIALYNKREQLWGEISDLEDALCTKKEELQEALDSRANHRQAERVLREELGSLRRRLRDQDASLSQATTASIEKVREANDRETLLQATVKQLEKRLQDQNKLVRDQQASIVKVTADSNDRVRDAREKETFLRERLVQLDQRLNSQRRAFEEERAQWQQQALTRQTGAQTELVSSLESAMPQLRSLLSAYDRVHGNEECPPRSTGKSPLKTTHKMIKQSNPDLTQRLKEQEVAFDQKRAQLLEQASDAAETQRDITRRNLLEREKVLICPITLELFDFPVVTGCCGKTFSSEGLRQAIRQNPLCPFCRGQLFSTHPNRDVAKLVEIHRRERSVLGITDPDTSSSSVSTPQINEQTTVVSTTSSRRSTGSTRQSRHRENRSDRVQARSQVPRRRSTAVRSTQGNAVSYATAVTATSSPSQPQDRSITPGGLYISTAGSDTPAFRVPPHMVRSVLASKRFPSARSQASATTRRQRSRAATKATSTASSTTTSASRRRAASAVSSAVPSATATVSNSVAPASQNTRRTRRSTRAARNTSDVCVPTSAVSIGASSAEVKFTPPASAADDVIANSRNSQRSRPSGSSSSGQGAVLSIATTATSTTSTTASSQPIRISASQDDSALGHERHDSPRLTASQPAPRQPLRTLALSITSLQDLLGSDFESDSDL